MTSRDFCYWLQGFFEINESGQPRPTKMTPVEDPGLNAIQVAMIKRHLAMVFVHEIDPSHGPQEHQDELQSIHDGLMLHSDEKKEDKVVYRC